MDKICDGPRYDGLVDDFNIKQGDERGGMLGK